MIEEFNSWVVHTLLKFCKIRIWNMKFKIRSSIYIVYFLISYKQMSIISYVYQHWKYILWVQGQYFHCFKHISALISVS
jgi:hypothetical protein